MEIIKLILTLFYYISLTCLGCEKKLAVHKRHLIYFYYHMSEFFYFLFFVAMIFKRKKIMELFLSFFNDKRKKEVLIRALALLGNRFFINDFNYNYMLSHLKEENLVSLLKFDSFSLHPSKQYLLINFYGLNYISTYYTEINNKLRYHYKKNTSKDRDIIRFYKPYFDSLHEYHEQENQSMFKIFMNLDEKKDYPIWLEKKQNKKLFAQYLITFQKEIGNSLLKKVKILSSIYSKQIPTLFLIYESIINKYYHNLEYKPNLMYLLEVILKEGLSDSQKNLRYFLKFLKNKDYHLNLNPLFISLIHHTQSLSDVKLLLKHVDKNNLSNNDLKKLEDRCFELIKLSYGSISNKDIKWLKNNNFCLSHDNFSILNKLILRDASLKLFKSDYDDNYKNIQYIFKHLSVQQLEQAFKIKKPKREILVKNFLWYSTNLLAIDRLVDDYDGHELYYLSLNTCPYHQFEIIFKSHPSIISEDALFYPYCGNTSIQEAIDNCNEKFIYDIFKVLDINTFSIEHIEEILFYIIKSNIKLEVKLYIMHKIKANINWSNFYVDEKNSLFPFFIKKISQEEKNYFNLILKNSSTSKNKIKI